MGRLSGNSAGRNTMRMLDGILITFFVSTDELGMKSVENVVTIHDLHATLLHLLGLNHEQLTYHFGGRDFRLTDVHGRVVSELIM